MTIQTTKVYKIVDKAIKKGYTTISAQGSSRCLGAGTLVRMHDGTLKPIESIVVGDKVMNIEGNEKTPLSQYIVGLVSYIR